MNYKTQFQNLEEQNKKVIEILSKNTKIMKILKFLYEMKVPNFYIASRSVFQTIWNYMEGNPLDNNIKDVDIVYFDQKHTTKEHEDTLEKKLKSFIEKENINLDIDVHNEARMQLFKKPNENPNIDYYENAEDAIRFWTATVQAIGITMDGSGLKVFATYGVFDIFSKTIRPIKHPICSKKLYYKKVKSWSKRFKDLTIGEW